MAKWFRNAEQRCHRARIDYCRPDDAHFGQVLGGIGGRKSEGWMSLQALVGVRDMSDVVRRQVMLHIRQLAFRNMLIKQLLLCVEASHECKQAVN